MKEINENEFDKLISESFVRQDILQDIEMSVMKSVKTEARKAATACSLLHLLFRSPSLASCCHILYITGIQRSVS